jgi:hypothetical protein
MYEASEDGQGSDRNVEPRKVAVPFREELPSNCRRFNSDAQIMSREELCGLLL